MKVTYPTQPATDEHTRFELPPTAFVGQTILITGATGGLGTALSFRCAEAGATVILTGRNNKKLNSLYDLLDERYPDKAAILPINQEVAGEIEYAQIGDLLQTEFGTLDALVHTAAELGPLTPFEGVTQADWSRVMAVNLSSARLLTATCLPLLRQSALGSVLFLLDHKPTAYWGAYGVSKSALLSMASMLADETDNQAGDDHCPRVSINGIDPGPMRTPLRRKAFPGELESESPPPHDKLNAMLALLSRSDRSLTGAFLHIET